MANSAPPREAMLIGSKWKPSRPSMAALTLSFPLSIALGLWYGDSEDAAGAIHVCAGQEANDAVWLSLASES